MYDSIGKIYRAAQLDESSKIQHSDTNFLELIKIYLIMQKKSSSCQRCSRNSAPHFTSSEFQKKIKKLKMNEQQLEKKFEELHNQGTKWRNKKQSMRQQEREKRQNKQLEECTFQPQTNDNHEFFLPEGSFLKRENDWKNSVNKKLVSQRQQKQMKQKNIYTFKPKISSDLSMNQSINLKSKKQINHQTQTSFNCSYTSRAQPQGKKSYRNIHAEQRKFKDLVKTTTKPFQHLRLKTSFTESKYSLMDLTHKEIQSATNRKQNPELASSHLVADFSHSSLHQNQIYHEQVQKMCEKNQKIKEDQRYHEGEQDNGFEHFEETKESELRNSELGNSQQFQHSLQNLQASCEQDAVL